MKGRFWKLFVRALIGIVVFFNLDAAFSFMIQPNAYAPGFELSGVPGQVIIQGMGLLFLMWNVPYTVAILDPAKHFTSLIEAVIMQAIGVFGESILLGLMPGEHAMIKTSAMRFILFDAGGLILLVIGFFITLRQRRNTTVGTADIKGD